MAPSRHNGCRLLQWLDVFKQTEYLRWKQILYEVSLFLVLCQVIKIINSRVTSRSHLQHKHNPADALDYQTLLTWPVVHQLPFRAQSPQLSFDPTADTENPDLSGYKHWGFFIFSINGAGSQAPRQKSLKYGASVDIVRRKSTQLSQKSYQQGYQEISSFLASLEIRKKCQFLYSSELLDRS